MLGSVIEDLLSVGVSVRPTEMQRLANFALGRLQLGNSFTMGGAIEVWGRCIYGLWCKRGTACMSSGPEEELPTLHSCAVVLRRMPDSKVPLIELASLTPNLCMLSSTFIINLEGLRI